MSNMINFYQGILSGIADFLLAEPVIYAFGLVLLAGLIRLIFNFTQRKFF